MKTRIGVLSAGRDCAGINPAIQWVVNSALDKDLVPIRGAMFEVVGIIDGWKGLIEVKPDKKETARTVSSRWTRNWCERGTGPEARASEPVSNPFDPKKDQSEVMIENIKKLGIDALVVIGGFDSLGVAYKLFREGIRVVGIPKTIDKDLSETDYTLGFDSAVNSSPRTSTGFASPQDPTAGSSSWRPWADEAGWLALEGGEACGAAITLIPEHDFVLDRVAELLKMRKKEGKRYSIVLVSEGAKPRGMEEGARAAGPGRLRQLLSRWDRGVHRRAGRKDDGA